MLSLKRTVEQSNQSSYMHKDNSQYMCKLFPLIYNLYLFPVGEKDKLKKEEFLKFLVLGKYVVLLYFKNRSYIAVFSIFE